MEKKGCERRKESDRPCTSRDFLRSRKRELCDRLWFGGEDFQQFRQRPVAASGGLKTRVLAIFGNHYCGNPRRPGRAKAVEAVFDHQATAGVEIKLIQRRQINRRMRLALRFIIRAANHIKIVPERELVQHGGDNLPGRGGRERNLITGMAKIA